MKGSPTNPKWYKMQIYISTHVSNRNKSRYPHGIHSTKRKQDEIQQHCIYMKVQQTLDINITHIHKQTSSKHEPSEQLLMKVKQSKTYTMHRDTTLKIPEGSQNRERDGQQRLDTAKKHSSYLRVTIYSTRSLNESSHQNLPQPANNVLRTREQVQPH